MFTILDVNRRRVDTADTVTGAQRLVDHYFRTDRAHAPFFYAPSEVVNRPVAPPTRRFARVRAWFSA